MDESTFHVTRVMPKVQYEEILNIEGICPVCHSQNVKYQKEYRCCQKVWQNHYTCLDCSTEWVGNSYTEDFKRVTKKEEERITPKIHPFLDGLWWLLKLVCCSDIDSL